MFIETLVHIKNCHYKVTLHAIHILQTISFLKLGLRILHAVGTDKWLQIREHAIHFVDKVTSLQSEATHAPHFVFICVATK